MRVCVISHAYHEERYRHALDALADLPEVTLALIAPNRYKLGLQTSSGEDTGTGDTFHTYSLPIRWGGRQGTYHYHSGPLRKALDEFRPDVILHEQEVYAIGAGQIAAVAKRRGIPHVMLLNENVRRKLALPRRWLRDYVLKRCDALIGVSSGSVDLHRYWGFHGPAAVIAQMGVTLNPAPAFGARKPGELSICYVGRLIPEKGVDCLLRAIALLHAEGATVKCSIAGKGPIQPELEALSRDLGLQDVVAFEGLLQPEAVDALLKSSDVLVLPSRRTETWEEQFGRVLIEAMAQGTIAVGTSTGAIGEVIASEDLLFPEDDHDGLAAVLRRLAEDETVLRLQQGRSWERVKQEYSSEAVARKKVEFLSRVVAERSSAAVLGRATDLSEAAETHAV